MIDEVKRFVDAADELLRLQQQLIGTHRTDTTIAATKTYIQARQILFDCAMKVVPNPAASSDVKSSIGSTIRFAPDETDHN